MLQKLNERIQGVIAWLVIGVIAFTFILFSVDYVIQSRQSSDMKATVGDVIITNQTFENNYRRHRSQQDPAKITAATEKKLKNEVLETLISNQVAVAAGRKYGFEISTDQTNTAIMGIPQFQEDGQFSTERYQQALNGALFTPESFQTEIRQGMLLNQQRFAFMGTAFVLPYEIEQFVKLYMQTRDYDYMIIPSSLFKKDIAVTSEEIKQFYETHQSEFQSPERVQIEYIQLSMPEVRSNIKITEEEIKNYYDENHSNYLVPAQWKVAHILFAVPQGAPEATEKEVLEKANKAYQTLQANPNQFNDLVSSLSDDKLSIKNKGMLPWIVAGQQPELDKSLVLLKTPGQVSPPVKTAHGYELFKLEAFKPATVKPFNDVKQIIAEQLQADRAQTQYAKLLEQLSDLSYQTPDSLTSISETLKLPIKKTGLFSMDKDGNDLSKNKDDLSKNKAVVSAAFSHDVLELGNNSEPIQVNNESVVVLRINKHIPASIKSLSEVSPVIKDSLVQEKATKKAEEMGNNLLESKMEAIKFIADNNLKWNAAKAIGRDGSTEIIPAINNLAYQIFKPDTTKGKSVPNGDYILVALKQINPGKIDSLDKEQTANLAQQIEANYGMMDYDLYLNHLIKQAKIEKH